MPTLWLHARLVVASPIWPSQLGSAGCTGPGDSCQWWHICPLTKSHAGCRGGQQGAGATWGHRSWNKGRTSRNQHMRVVPCWAVWVPTVLWGAGFGGVAAGAGAPKYQQLWSCKCTEGKGCKCGQEPEELRLPFLGESQRDVWKVCILPIVQIRPADVTWEKLWMSFCLCRWLMQLLKMADRAVGLKSLPYGP